MTNLRSPRHEAMATALILNGRLVGHDTNAQYYEMDGKVYRLTNAKVMEWGDSLEFACAVTSGFVSDFVERKSQ